MNSFNFICKIASITANVIDYTKSIVHKDTYHSLTT